MSSDSTLRFEAKMSSKIYRAHLAKMIWGDSGLRLIFVFLFETMTDQLVGYISRG